MHSDTRQKERPARLGFFSSNPNAIDPCRITWIDTEVLCDHCYEKAVPQGFVVWSCTYNAIRGGDDYYPTRECFPPMVRAGCEEKPNVPACHIIEGIPIPDTKVVHMLWDRIQEDGRPFYIDLLHMYPPYDKAATDKDAEARRVFHANALAYRNAARGYSGLYANGGKHSLVEQRMLRNRQALDAEKWLSTRTGVSEEPLDSFYNNLVRKLITYPGRVKKVYRICMC